MTFAAYAEDIHLTIGDRQILSGISLGLIPGQVTGILGTNGAGKSTLLGVLSGDVPPSSGSVFYQQQPLESLSNKQRARIRSVMLQDVSVPFSYLVHDIVEMGRFPYDPSEKDAGIIRQALSDADIVHLQDRDVTTLSGGERARVAFARVLAQATPVVLLDEPTAALDIAHQEHLMRRVRRLAQEGVAVGVILHDLNLAAAYCDCIAMLDDGRVRAYGNPHDVLTSDLLTDVYGWEIDVMDTARGIQIVPVREPVFEPVSAPLGAE